MANGICQLLWLRKLLDELGFSVIGPMNLFCDNKTAISIAHDLVQYDKTKHEEIDRNFIKNHIKFGRICFPFIHTKYQLTDIFTKGSSNVHYSYIVDKPGMIDIYSLA